MSEGEIIRIDAKMRTEDPDIYKILQLIFEQIAVNLNGTDKAKQFIRFVSTLWS